MGNFRVEVEAVGGHGCQRELKDGAEVTKCSNPSCPDCMAREFVAALKATGNSLVSAKLIHWPGQKSEVRDDLLTGIRSGSF